MLIVTNRQANATATDGSAFTSKFSVDGEALSVAHAVKVQNGDGWETRDVQSDAKDSAISNRIGKYLADAQSHGRHVLVYVHGNNNDYTKMLQRCYDLTSTYEAIEVIGFSWPSEGYLPGQKQVLSDFERDMGEDDALDTRKKYTNWVLEKRARYLQAKTNAEGSSKAFARFLKLAGKGLANADANAGGTLSVHSLGNHLLLDSIDKYDADKNLKAYSNILLLAPAVPSPSQGLLLDKLQPKKRVFVTYNKNDWVLAGAQIVDGESKLGLDPGTPALRSANPKVRYVDFENASAGAGHRYFVNPKDTGKKTTKALFARTFYGLDDVNVGEGEQQVYPFGCSADGKTCFMGANAPQEPGG